MPYLFTLINVLLMVFYLCLLARIVFDWVKQFARGWRPGRLALVGASGVYAVTDPPVKALRRLIPPINLSGISLDVSLLVLFVATWILLNITGRFAA